MNVWVVKTSEMLAGDNGNGRLLRSGLIAHMLDARGHDVTWWMSTFDHAGRRNRFNVDTRARFGGCGSIRMIHSPGYEASISLARVRDHSIWGRHFAAAIASEPSPDIIFCAYPTIEAAAICARFGRRRSVPVVIDLRDMWPDIFVERVPRFLKPLARLALLPIRARARSALRGATALFAITDEFLQWGLALARRARREWDDSFLLSYPTSDFVTVPQEDAASPEDFWDRLNVRRDDAFNVVLVGTITSRRFELDTVLSAARELQHDPRPVRFIIAGDGDDLPKYRDAGRDCANVLFPGWLRKPQIGELLSRAHLGLVPYRNTADLVISIPNKVAEYFSSGVPIATCLSGTLAGLLRERGCGLTFLPSRPETLVNLVRRLRDDEALRVRLAENARTTFYKEFVAEAVYGRLIERLEAIARARADTSSVRAIVHSQARRSNRG